MTTDSEINWPKQAAIGLTELRHRDVTSKLPPIKYGQWEFSAPRLMFNGPMPAKPGLYAIQVRKWNWFATRYEPIYFGESSNFYRRLLVDDGGFVHWLMHPHAVHGLFVSLCPTIAMDKSARELAVDQLLVRYSPDLTRSAEELMAQLDEPHPGNRPGNRGANAAREE